MVEFHNLVKQINEERSKLEEILVVSITKLEEAGLNTDKFENPLFYYDSFNEEEEGENYYAYLVRMIASHNIEYMAEKKTNIWDFSRLKKLIEDWVSTAELK